MDDPGLVGVFQCGQDPDNDFDGLVDRNGVTISDDVADRVTLDVLHHDEWHVCRGTRHLIGVRLLASVVHRDNCRVVEGRGRLGLAPEARLERRVACEVGAQNLDRDGSTEPGIVADVNFRHSAAADQFTDLIPASENPR